MGREQKPQKRLIDLFLELALTGKAKAGRSQVSSARAGGAGKAWMEVRRSGRDSRPH